MVKITLRTTVWTLHQYKDGIKVNTDETDWMCSTYEEVRNSCEMRFWYEICSGRRPLADSGTDGRIS